MVDQTYFAGRQFDFRMVLDSYEPNVMCVDRSPDPAPSNCQGALEFMPKDIDERRSSDDQVAADALLPQLFLGRELHLSLGQ